MLKRGKLELAYHHFVPPGCEWAWAEPEAGENVTTVTWPVRPVTTHTHMAGTELTRNNVSVSRDSDVTNCDNLQFLWRDANNM